MTKSRGHAVLLVDRSYSMLRIKEEAEQGVQTFKDKQAEVTDAKITMSLYEFSDQGLGRAGYWKKWGPLKVAQTPDYTLEPDGNTALYDAVARVIIDTEKEIEAMEKKPGKVVVAIMTDGQENSSIEYNFEHCKALIKRKKADGWEIIFLAGTMEAVAFGKSSGLNTTSYNPLVKGQTAGVYASAASGSANYFAGVTRTVEMPESIDADD